VTLKKPVIKIRQINAKTETNEALLRWLQLAILPLDTPADTSQGHWWLVTKDEAPVGFAGLHRSTNWNDAGYLCRAGLLQAARGMGLQKRLIQVRQSKAQALGYRWLITDTYMNPASANSLIACGFKMFTPSSPWGVVGTCYWRKELKG
jgi:GNAT superfamily N-acetyltransferase